MFALRSVTVAFMTAVGILGPTIAQANEACVKKHLSNTAFRLDVKLGAPAETDEQRIAAFLQRVGSDLSPNDYAGLCRFLNSDSGTAALAYAKWRAFEETEKSSDEKRNIAALNFDKTLHREGCKFSLKLQALNSNGYALGGVFTLASGDLSIKGGALEFGTHKWSKNFINAGPMLLTTQSTLGITADKRVTGQLTTLFHLEDGIYDRPPEVIEFNGRHTLESIRKRSWVTFKLPFYDYQGQLQFKCD